MTYEITIDGTPKTWNAFVGNRTNWAYYKYKKAIQNQILLAGLGSRNRLSKVQITYCIGYPTRIRSDIDSLCTKPHLDALVQLKVIEDDNKEIVREVRITWEKSEKPYTKIIITEL